MTLHELFGELSRRGVGLVADGDRLVVRGEKGVLDADLVSAIRTHKGDLLDALRGAGGPRLDSAGRDEEPRPRPKGSPVVPSESQKRFWDLQRLAPEPRVYNVPGAFRLKGPLQVAALKRALQTFVSRHEVLRSRFVGGPDGLEIRVDDRVEVQVPVDDLTGVDEGQRDDALKEYLEARSDDPLDLEEGPPFAIRLARLGPDDHALLFVAHSLAWDGWSFDLLLMELKEHYEAQIADCEPEPPADLDLQYSDYAAWQKDQLESGLLDRCMDYWQTQLSGTIPSLRLPADAAPGASADYAGARSWFQLEKDAFDGVRTLARSERTTPYAVLLAAFKVLLHRYSGVEDVLVASPVYGRNRPELESLVGPFANTLFLRTSVDSDISFREVVRRVHAATAGAMEFQAAPTARVAEALRRTSPSRSPYEALFVFQQTAKRPAHIGPLSVQSIRRGTRRVAVDLTVWVREYDDYIDGAFDYRTAMFEPETIEVMARHLSRLVLDATERPDLPVHALEFSGDGEYRRIAAWQDDSAAEMLRAGGVPTREGAANLGATLLDPLGRPVGIHVQGEIHAGMKAGGSGWNGTGVRARWTARGQLRLSEQREAAGLDRADLEMIAAVLGSHPDTEEAAAAIQPASDGSPRFVGYVVWNTVTPPFPGELRRYLAAELPDALTPGVTLELEELPRTGDGEVDHSALPNPFQETVRPAEQELATETEQAVADVWLGLLDIDHVRADDNFFELGGHSLLAVEAVAQLERRFGTRVEARDTFFHSLRQIAANIDDRAATSGP